MFIRIACAALALVLMFPAAALAQPAFGPDYNQTQFGPMGPAGRDMLVKVRLAGLWEGPAGRLGLQKSANPLVQEASRHLVEGHTELDAKVLELGRQLNVTLPTEPNADQKGWLAELEAAPARSQEFDRIFANRLRAAHGTVYKFLAEVRTGTRNTAVRDFAKRCMEVVLDHIQVVEATNMVDFNDTQSIPLAKIAQTQPALPQLEPGMPPLPVDPPRTGFAQPGLANEPTSVGTYGSGALVGVALLAGLTVAVLLWAGAGRRRGKIRV